MKQLKVNRITLHTEMEKYMESDSKVVILFLYYWYKLRGFTIEYIKL
jgi:hypothetical protein